ncbi:MAG: hypothetical protein HY22_13285 [[Candidatus Thermochlorobacteriaceae] bacterium GBChlB]|nr:MAG: hypothetical protein HY22_13285 [[Candidatus Thermochlorobacteriaceae] bacterium GBChlB]
MKNTLLYLALLLANISAFAQTPIPISQARTRTVGTVVTIAGRVTVGNQFRGPSYLQDGTAGIAVFDNAIHNGAVTIGDSVVITGPISTFNQLLQISGAGTTFQVIASAGRVAPQPRVLTIAQLNALTNDQIEGQLVQINNVRFTTPSFQGNQNYDVSDGTGTVQLRVDADADIVGATAPTDPTTVIAVVGRFNQTRQILPRSREDIGAREFVIPFENRPRSETFEVCTWNIEWLGDPVNGPRTGNPPVRVSNNLQIQNAATVIRRIDADLYALQEISSDAAFRQLVDSVRGNGYTGFRTPTGQTQRLAFLWKTATVDSVSFRTIADSGNWSQFQGVKRLPAELTINARIGAVTRRMRVINIHADAGSAIADYNRRVADAGFLKRQLDRELRNEAFILLGDYNDDVDVSITPGQPTPYANFVNDPANYRIVTGFLSARGLQSFSGTGSQMIDHITISRQLFPAHLDSTQRVENTVYIPNYVSTTSDHFPVWTRLDLARVASTRIERAPQPTEYRLFQNYPNPFNPTTTIRYNLPASGFVSLKVYDVLGREVSSLVNERQTAGSYESRFNAANLPSGMYFYRLQSGTFTETRKMLLVK